MSNIDLFKQAGVPAVADFKKGLQQARQQAPALTSGVQYLKMNQVGMTAEGFLTYGAEQTEVQENSRWVVNTFGIEHGFILRDGGSVNGEAYAPITSPLPADLRPVRGSEQWRQCYKCHLVCISGEDVGVVVEYSGDAGGVVKLFKSVLLPGIEAQLDVDADKIFPVLTFEVTSYHSNKQHKDIYEAQGTIVDWVSNDDIVAVAGKEDAPAPQPAAAATAPAEPAGERQDPPTPAAEAEVPARPAGQRRRRAAAP